MSHFLLLTLLPTCLSLFPQILLFETLFNTLSFKLLLCNFGLQQYHFLPYPIVTYQYNYVIPSFSLWSYFFWGCYFSVLYTSNILLSTLLAMQRIDTRALLWWQMLYFDINRVSKVLSLGNKAQKHNLTYILCIYTHIHVWFICCIFRTLLNIQFIKLCIYKL